MIVIEWHLLVYIIINLLVFIWAVTRDGNTGFLDLGSDRFWAFGFFWLVAIISTLIYGGIYWW